MSVRVIWCLPAVMLAAACAAGGGDATRAPTTSAPATTAVATADTPAIAVAPAMPGPRTEKWIDLAVGDCLADPPPSDPSVVTVAVVDCATSHMAEVYSRVPVTVDAATADVANRECTAGFNRYTGQAVAASSYSVTYLIDSNQDRTDNDPQPSTVICLLQADDDQPLSGSARR